MLNYRQCRIIDLLQEHGQWIKGKALASLLQVNGRTIRSDIERINYETNGCIISSPQKGYMFQNTDSQKGTAAPIPQTADERILYILRCLLQKKECGIQELMSDLCISEFTLDHDLKKVRELLKSSYSLNLRRIRNFVSLNGSEEKKRDLYKYLLNEETKGNFLNFDHIASLFKHLNLFEVKKILELVLDSYSIRLRKTSVPMVMMHIGIALERMQSGNTLNTNTYPEDVSDMKEFEASNDFYNRMETRLGKTVNLDERKLLAYLLSEKMNMGHSCSFEQNHHIEDLIARICDLLYQNYDVDFRNDKDLLAGFSLHLHSLIHRAKNNQQSSNVFLGDIKKKYPLVFDMSVQICNLLSHSLGIGIDENEMGFIALHIGTAYERSRVQNRYRILLIIPHEEEFVKYCQDCITRKFFERIEIIGNLTIVDETLIQHTNPDLILVTAAVQHSLHIPTYKISILFNAEDEALIFHALNRLDKQKSHNALIKEIRSYINSKYFYIDQEFDTPEEIISYMCNRLEQDTQVDADFKASVLERERISSTSFYYAFATPHALNCPALHSNISIMILKKPVKWGEFSVKMVLLLAIRKQDCSILKMVFDWLAQMARSAEGFQKIFNSKDYDDFLKQFIEYEFD